MSQIANAIINEFVERGWVMTPLDISAYRLEKNGATLSVTDHGFNRLEENSISIDTIKNQIVVTVRLKGAMPTEHELAKNATDLDRIIIEIDRSLSAP